MHGCIIYGGSFNPVHIAHLRLAIEVSWLLADYADRLEFVPSARHPQKKATSMLPFALRMEMLQASIKDLPLMTCNGIEGKRDNVSYTIDTLKYYLQNWHRSELFFLVGSQDYALMNSWHKWRELPGMCNLVVAPRGEYNFMDFFKTTKRLWPDCADMPSTPDTLLRRCPTAGCLKLTDNTSAFYLPVQWLPISSSHIRQLWREGKNPEWLLPPVALNILNQNQSLVNSCWNEEEHIC